MNQLSQPTTSPQWQYVATAVIAIIAIVSAMSIISQQKAGEYNVQFQTMSINEHSTSLEELAAKEYDTAGDEVYLPLPREKNN